MAADDDFMAEMDTVAAGYSEGATATAPPDAPEAPAADEAPAPASAPPAEGSVLDRDPESIPDDIPYRDASALRSDLARARDRYRPFEQAFAGIDPSSLQQLGDTFERLGAYGPQVLNGLAQMADGDRDYMAAAIEALSSGTPEARADVAARFFEAAEFLNGGTMDPGDIPDPLDPTPAVDPMDRPMTLRELEAWNAEQTQARLEADAVAEITREIRDLGYNPDSNDPVEAGRVAQLLEIARRDPDGSIQEAHKAVQAERQRIIDEYVSGKTADAGRAPAPDGGAQPAPERPVETMDDAEAAMRARLEATLGPR